MGGGYQDRRDNMKRVNEVRTLPGYQGHFVAGRDFEEIWEDPEDQVGPKYISCYDKDGLVVSFDKRYIEQVEYFAK